MIIQLPEWENLRIAGDKLEWEIQVLIKDKKADGGKRWAATNFFPTLDSAVAFAYERTLKENGLVTDDLREAEKECRKVKDSLLKAVRKREESNGSC